MSVYFWTVPYVTPLAAEPAADGTVDHAARMVASLRAQYVDAPGFAEVLSAFGAEFQELEDALVAMATATSISGADGVRLDMLGAIVNEPRAGRTDELYRRGIRARSSINHSTGSAESLIDIARGYLDGFAGTLVVEAVNLGYGEAEIRILGVTLTEDEAKDLHGYLQEGAAAGVLLRMQWSATVGFLAYDVGVYDDPAAPYASMF